MSSGLSEFSSPEKASALSKTAKRLVHALVIGTREQAGVDHRMVMRTTFLILNHLLIARCHGFKITRLSKNDN